MHHKTTKAFYETFPLKDKSDALAGYLYLKYTKHFYFHALKMQGIDAEPPEENIDEGIDEMLQMLVQQIADSTASHETNLYHGKVMKKEDAKKLLSLKESINITPSDRVMPFKVARQLLIENPESIAAVPCVCRFYSKDPCYPKDKEICLFVGDPQASFVEHHNSIARKVSQDEAINILEIAHQHGFVHTAYFEKAVGERLNAICNCCSCCCGGMKAWNMYEGAIPLLAPSGYLAKINEDCTGCGECISACNFNALSISDDDSVAAVDAKKCMGCGICEDVCPAGVITLEREPSKGDPLDIDEMA